MTDAVDKGLIEDSARGGAEAPPLALGGLDTDDWGRPLPGRGEGGAEAPPSVCVDRS